MKTHSERSEADSLPRPLPRLRSCGSGSLVARRLLAIAVVAWLLLPAEGRAEEPGRRSPMDLSIEQLLNESVTSVSRRQTKLSEAATAVTVITQEDIRRSGVTAIPEALRMVPGMQVARINANEWAVTARGFNNQYANKLLVLVDGRSVYTPSSGGVYWNAQDLMLEDLDRIEVIRGPGATMWGANAVNGVVNIITKSAKETQGWLTSVAYGTHEQPITSVRYGGQLGTNLYYRAFVKYFNREGFVDLRGDEAADDSKGFRGGLQFDWEPSPADKFMLQGSYYRNQVEEQYEQASLVSPFNRSFEEVRENNGAHVLGRWNHTFSDVSDFTLQAYYDNFHQHDGVNHESRDTYDFDLQHRFGLWERHDVTWGVGYRYTADKLPGSFTLTWLPETKEDHLYSGFVQDEITLVEDRLKLTLGSKFEHNSYTGFEVQPSGRLLWTPTEKQSIWASVFRAVRTPARYDAGHRLNAAAFQTGPGSPVALVSLFSDRNPVSEKLLSYEIGYRVEPLPAVSFDLAGFYNQYDDIFTYVAGQPRFEASPAPPHLLIPSRFSNATSGHTFGAELTAQWRVTDHWKLTAGYTWLHMHLHGDDATENGNPQNQFHIRSHVNLPYNVEFNTALYYVQQIATFRRDSIQDIPSYVRLDIGLNWHVTRSLQVGIWGQNLLDDRHPEFAGFKSSRVTEIPRSVLCKATWSF